MDETTSPPPCPNTVTIRRKPRRKAPVTPSSSIPFPVTISSPSPSRDIPSKNEGESLKVFLRIRPLIVNNGVKKHTEEAKTAWPKKPKPRNASGNKVKSRKETCLTVNDSHSVTVSPPENLQDAKRGKSEVYEGFSNVFPAESTQTEVYDKMVKQLVEDFLNGKSGMLAALGPSGSGKTHTVFGCARDPGMVPLALRHIFSEKERNETQLARTFYLSIFEICSERGKSEKMYDLLREGGELYLQQSIIKGLRKETIRDAQHAESLIAHAMLKRATATTNSNTQSSRSQCIINISYDPKKIDGNGEDEPHSTVLTIVDLAGAEREKKTGNQGLRLLESNFINNTSMVFGLCLRSLLEHQKNPKRPLHKHFQSSLLTRYLRTYFEGKKRMSLVLTVKPAEEDYLDTSNLLKQASPCMQIKFTSIEEAGNIKCFKRPIQTFPRAEPLKRMKFSEFESSLIDERQVHGDQLSTEEITAEKVEDASLTDILVECEGSLSSQLNGGQFSEKHNVELAKREREHEITLNFAKALWNVLKQYKKKLEVAEEEICCLKDNLIKERKRCSDLENEVKDLKRQSSDQVYATEPDGFGANHSLDIKQSQYTEFEEENVSTSANDSCPAANALKEQLSQTSDQLECLNSHDHDIENSSASGNLRTEDGKPDIGETDDLTALCDGVVEIAGPGENIGDLEDINGEHNFSFCKAKDFSVLTGGERKDTDRENAESDHSESAVSFSQSCKELGIINPRSVRVEDVCASKTVRCSSSSPIVTISADSLGAGMDHFQPQEHKEEVLDPPAAPKPEENVSCTYVPELAPRCSTQSKVKSKRRLLPSSCILLKDIGSLAIEDESDKPKGAKGKKKEAMDIKSRTKGSESLLRILRSNLHP